MKSKFLLAIFAIVLNADLTMASAPAPIAGPDSYHRYLGSVESVRNVKNTIGTSDISGEEREYVEVMLKVIHADRVELPEHRPELKPTHTTHSTEVKKAGKEVPTPEIVGKSLRFFFAPNLKFSVGEILEISTRTRQAVSQGWTGSEYGASFKREPNRKDTSAHTYFINDKSVSKSEFEKFTAALNEKPSSRKSGESPRGHFSSYQALDKSGDAYVIVTDGNSTKANRLPK